MADERCFELMKITILSELLKVIYLIAAACNIIPAYHQ
jgi:hypothetical protein